MISCLEHLISRLNALSTKATSDFLGSLLQETTVDTKDLGPVLEFGEINYKRNKIASSNWYDLWVICWKAGQSSPIHDHKDSSCAFRVVDGVASERVFKHAEEAGLVRLTGKRNYRTGVVVRAYKDDIHKISNDSESQTMVTLHVYSPPLQMTYYEEAL